MSNDKEPLGSIRQLIGALLLSSALLLLSSQYIDKGLTLRNISKVELKSVNQQVYAEAIPEVLVPTPSEPVIQPTEAPKPIEVAQTPPPVVQEPPKPVEKPKPVPKPKASVGNVEQIVRDAARKYGINEEHFVKIARCESTFNPNAVNKNYYENGHPSGLFQHISGYWPKRAATYGHAGASVFDPVANAEVTAQMFRDGQSKLWECR